jgi:hypothetical protein
MIKKFVGSLLTIALILMTTGIINPFVASAATITTASDLMSRLKASTASNHEIKFVTPTGMAVGTNMTLVFSSGFTGVGSLVVGDFDVAENSGNNCNAGSWTERSMGAGSTQFNAVGSSQTVTITAGATATPITAGRCMRIRIGTNATDTTGGTGPGVHQITNGATGGTDTVTIGGTFGDSGAILVEIMDDDSVSITATVNQTISFDLDVGYTTGETGQPYQVPLNTLSASAVSESNGTSIKTIFADGGTNASGGMNVSIANANGANGLKSTSVPTDFIGSTTGTMTVGTANYGLCVGTANLVGFAKATAYNTTCAVNSGTNGIVGLTTTPAGILTSSAPVATGHADIVVNAEISNATPAHTDYADTLTFIATASF